MVGLSSRSCVTMTSQTTVSEPEPQSDKASFCWSEPPPREAGPGLDLFLLLERDGGHQSRNQSQKVRGRKRGEALTLVGDNTETLTMDVRCAGRGPASRSHCHDNSSHSTHRQKPLTDFITLCWSLTPGSGFTHLFGSKLSEIISQK